MTSWSGTAVTSAREVFVPEVLFGDHRLRELRLPAIDLSPIGNACGGRIDGILGVDLLDKMGVTIDLKRRIASVSPVPTTPAAPYKQMEEDVHHCTSAFETGNAAELGDCFDSEIVLFALQREYRGRDKVMKYLQDRFLQYAPLLTYKMKLDDVKLFGDALWYTYDYEIISPKEHLAGRGTRAARHASQQPGDETLLSAGIGSKEKEKVARPGRLELPTLCLEAIRTTLPNLARGVANRMDSASWGKFSQTIFSFLCSDLPRNCRRFRRFA